MIRNESEPQGQEQNSAVENPTLEFDNVERMPYRVSEWFALMDRNRERECLGLEPIYPWENHPELATGVEVSDEANNSYYSDIVGPLSHLSL